MIKDNVYFKQADLLLNVIPFLYKEKDFAIKGGTAINFFVRNMPRLSVDIDLVYLLVNDRKTALVEISNVLLRISDALKRSAPGIVTELKKFDDLNLKLFVIFSGVTIKIEPNTILRGCVFQPQILHLCEKGRKNFEKDVIVQSLSTADTYGGKICAALDRQHPRDLFDIKLLFDNEGITDDIRKAFIIYLISHPRPISELLNPNIHDIKMTYENEFAGMTDDEVSYNQLLQTRERLVSTIQKDLTENEKEFLITFKNKTPDWKLLDLYHNEDPVFNIDRIKSLPAVKWKLFNLEKMTKKKHLEALTTLEQVLRIL
jgi:predicted nucleotidyltransferase component of viral defense system